MRSAQERQPRRWTRGWRPVQVPGAPFEGSFKASLRVFGVWGFRGLGFWDFGVLGFRGLGFRV